VLGLAEARGRDPPAFQGELGGTKQDPVAVPVADLGSEADSGVAGVVRAEDLPNASLDVTEEPPGGLTGVAEGRSELALGGAGAGRGPPAHRTRAD